MNGSRSSSGQLLDVRAEHDRRRGTRAGSSGSRGAGVSQHSALAKPAAEQPLLGGLGGGVVPRRREAREVLGVGLALADRARSRRAGRRCCPPPRTARPAARRGAARRAGARTAARGRRSSGRWRSRGSRPAGSSSSSSSRSQRQHLGVRAEALARRLDHRRRLVDGDHAPARQALDQRFGDRAPSRSRRRARVSSPASSRRSSTSRPRRLHRRRRCGRSWLRPTHVADIRPYVITYAVRTARRAPRSPSRAALPARRSASAADPRRLHDEARAGDRLAPSARRRPAGGPGRPRRGCATTTVGTRRAGRARARLLERARARHHFERVGDRLRMLVGGEPLAQDRLDVSRASRRGTLVEVIGARRSPPPRPRAALAASASQRASSPASARVRRVERRA